MSREESTEELLSKILERRRPRSSRWFSLTLLIPICILVFLVYNLLTEYQKHGSRIFTLETTRIGENETAIAELSTRLKSLEKTLNDFSSALESPKSVISKIDDDSATRIATTLLEDDRLRSEVVKSIADSPTDGLLTEHAFQASAIVTDERIGALDEALDRLKPVYDAIDLENREQTLAVPLIRKDIDSLNTSVDELEARVKDDRKNIETQLAVETSRIYDLGKWFLGLIVVACILPLLEPLFKRPVATSSSSAKSDDATNASDG